MDRKEIRVKGQYDKDTYYKTTKFKISRIWFLLTIHKLKHGEVDHTKIQLKDLKEN